jgi:hypothetical protein
MGRVGFRTELTLYFGPEWYVNQILHYYGSHLHALNECIIR